ncbi:MAG TPA: hypothetical protein VJ835_02480 [Fimbriimonadaceae bacterium]|nr:hypothetical protein [Fimbriimonadaceae bacterium]
MTNDRAEYAAKSILEAHPNESSIRIAIDNPNDCKPTMKAFQKLGWKVKLEKMGEIMVVTRP